MAKRVLRLDRTTYPRLKKLGRFPPGDLQRMMSLIKKAGARVEFYEDDDGEGGLLGALFPTEESFHMYFWLLTHKPRRLRL